MQRFPIKRGNHPIDGHGFTCLFEPRDFRSTDASATALQLDEPQVKSVGIFLADAENDGIDNTSTRRPSSAFEKGNAPLVGLAVRAKCFFAGSFGGAGFGECAQSLFGGNSFLGGGAALACECGFLAGGQIG